MTPLQDLKTVILKISDMKKTEQKAVTNNR